MRFTTLVLFTLATGLAHSLRAQSVPGTINFQGRLTDNSPQQNPLTATVPMQFAIYDAPAAGARLWREPDADGGTTPVAVTGGIFNVLLGGNGVPLPASVFSGGTQRFLEITAGGDVLTPRQAISATGYASQAQNSAAAATAVSAASATNAQQLGGVAAAGYQLATAHTCGAGQFVNQIGNGSAVCGAPPANNLTLPVALTAASGSPILSASNTGAGAGLSGKAAAVYAAGVYGENTSGLTATSGVYGYSTGNNSGVWGFNDTGTGTYGQSASGTGVKGYSDSGRAGYFSVGAANSYSALDVYTAGSRYAATFNITNAADPYAAVIATTNGAGPGLQGYATGAGQGGSFQINNPANGSDALYATSNGTGTAVRAASGASGVKGIVVQGYSGQSANLQEWQNSSGAPLASVSAAGVFSGSGAGLSNLPGANLTPPVTLAAASAGDLVTVFNNGTGGGVSVTANNAGSNATALSVVKTGDAGAAVAGYNNSTAKGYAGLFSNTMASNSWATLVAHNYGGGPGIWVWNEAPGARGLVVEGAAGQTANLQEWQNSAGAPLASVSAAGVFTGDGSGLTALQGGSLAPPVALSAASAGPILSATNTGAGYAAQFSVSNGAGFQHALFASNNGGGDTVVGAAYGAGTGVTGYAPNATGSGGRFSVGNAANPSFALRADTNGTGGAAFFSVGNGTGGVLSLYHAGTGDLLYASTPGGQKFRVDNGGVATAGGLVIAPSGATFNTDQGGTLELGGANLAVSAPGVTPYVDFHYGNNLAQDYNVRLVNDADGLLSLKGRLDTSAAVAANGVEIKSGPLKVDGAGINSATTAFIHLTTGATVTGNRSVITHPLTDNDPNAILIVTHNYNPGGGGGITLNKPVGVFYVFGHWTIYLEDSTAMPQGIYFNVLVIKP